MVKCFQVALIHYAYFCSCVDLQFYDTRFLIILYYEVTKTELTYTVRGMNNSRWSFHLIPVLDKNIPDVEETVRGAEHSSVCTLKRGLEHLS